MGIVMFNGVSSQDIHTLVQTAPEYAFPEKDYVITHVEGRNGDIVVDSGSWKNVTRTYNLAIDARRTSYSDIASKLVQWLHSASGYARLEDSYEPEYYRLAMYKDEGSITNVFNKAGQIEISFNCKPQRYLKSGEYKDVISGTLIYRNPTDFSSKPKIIVHGSGNGNIIINGNTIEIKQITDGMIIDCDLQDVYFNDINCNKQVLINEFPKLISGNNEISTTDGISSVEIIPRWWTL